MKFYDTIPDMECLSGDTLPEFRISPKTGSFDNCAMELILSAAKSSVSGVLCKECTPDGGGFRVRLTSEDTVGLAEGEYMLHFRLVDGQGLSHRKLVGRLFIRKAAKGEL